MSLLTTPALPWVRIVKLLLTRGATINAVDRDGCTALHRAATHGRSEIIKLLLESGATIDAIDKYGRTALHRAATNGHLTVVNLLQEYWLSKQVK